MKQLSATDAAWLAGFIDGDGCYTCSVWERRQNKSLPSITIAPRILAVQIATQRQVLDHIREITGVGKVYDKEEKSNKLNSQKQGQWVVGNLQDILEVCEAIHPYTVLKKRQCGTMIELLKDRIHHSPKLGERKKMKRTPMEATLYHAKLALSLNPESTNGRNSRHTGEKRSFDYWEKRIPEVYAEADSHIRERADSKKVTLSCTTCGKEFQRYICNIKNSKKSFCSRDCVR